MGKLSYFTNLNSSVIWGSFLLLSTGGAAGPWLQCRIQS